MYNIQHIRKALRGSGVRVSSKGRPYPFRKVISVSNHFIDYYYSNKQNGFNASLYMLNIFVL